VPRRVFRLIECVCGEEVTLLLAAMDTVECKECGAAYDPRTGEQLPVCDGFEIPGVTRRGSRRSSSPA